jgi:hypothetical protein
LVYFNCIFITNTGTSSFVAAFQVTILVLFEMIV